MTGAKPALQTEFVDPAHENAVLEALADDAFDFRTIQGLSEATGLSSSQVLAVLEKRADDIRVAAVSDSNGNTLYTLKSRPPKLQERLSEALAFLAGSAR